MMSLDDLLTLLDCTPVIAEIPPVSICYLPEDVTVLASAAEAAWQLDAPEPMLPGRLLITASDIQYADRFPHVRCDHDPFTPALNTILFDRYDDIASRMLCQSQAVERIVVEAGQYDFVILFLVDGLSYQDVRSWADSTDQLLSIEPCLVDVPTLTRVAFPNLIGDPPVAVRLFDAGYHHRLGFTYWMREDNQLTDRLFHTIAEVKKIGHFSQILATLRRHLSNPGQRKSYGQIMRTGLDGYAHAQKRRPPIAAIVEEVRREFEQLTALCGELCSELGLRACLYLTADHGILWRDEFEPKVIGDAPGKSSPRWCGWRDLYHQRDKGRRFLIDGEEYYCLDFPKLRRPLRIDEQGVHGGISFQESIVPFITVRIGD
ncbi:MAG: hypothetical protein H8E47_04535 [Anaerolineales bacterium]|nr:hypothetical protein [Anaerolineales bacterium]